VSRALACGFGAGAGAGGAWAQCRLRFENPGMKFPSRHVAWRERMAQVSRWASDNVTNAGAKKE
jgi:hypothetical protein